ncbi:helix-turn-helix domain-containing protein [Anaerocolumna sedimenticola]|uniref:Helix-turn-helix domain-containing protein n=1 Tax=Anaerocolumna sedimenticola TaxID=2696063 RepID=A0A6P1TSQ2_9FIRM|nr:helix-turn-helix domain-containing protein [Anaerocolumna sedimenticola]
MEDNGISNKSELCECINISSRMVTKIFKGKSVIFAVIERISKELDCEISDAVKIKFNT